MWSSWLSASSCSVQIVHPRNLLPIGWRSRRRYACTGVRGTWSRCKQLASAWCIIITLSILNFRHVKQTKELIVRVAHGMKRMTKKWSWHYFAASYTINSTAHWRKLRITRPSEPATNVLDDGQPTVFPLLVHVISRAFLLLRLHMSLVFLSFNIEYPGLTQTRNSANGCS